MPNNTTNDNTSSTSSTKNASKTQGTAANDIVVNSLSSVVVLGGIDDSVNYESLSEQFKLATTNK